MEVSKFIEDVIERNLTKMVNNVPLLELLVDLRECKILSDTEIVDLRNIQSPKQRNIAFINILKCRQDHQFDDFCNLLCKHQSKVVHKLGVQLQKDSYGEDDVIRGRLLCTSI